MRAYCRGRMVKGASAEIPRPRFNYLVGHRLYQTKIILNLAGLPVFRLRQNRL